MKNNLLFQKQKTSKSIRAHQYKLGFQVILKTEEPDHDTPFEQNEIQIKYPAYSVEISTQ